MKLTAESVFKVWLETETINLTCDIQVSNSEGKTFSMLKFLTNLAQAKQFKTNILVMLCFFNLYKLALSILSNEILLKTKDFYEFLRWENLERETNFRSYFVALF